MRISDWSSDVCSSDLRRRRGVGAVLRDGLCPSARHRHDRRSPGCGGARRPPLRAAADGSPGPVVDGARQRGAVQHPGRDRCTGEQPVQGPGDLRMSGAAAMNHNPGLHDFMPGPALGADGIARAGQRLPAGTAAATEAEVIEALKTVYDPEIPVNIYDLVLIYDLEVFDDGSVRIDMTLKIGRAHV